MSSIARAEIAPLAVFARLRPAKQGIPTALSVVVPEGDDAGAKPRVVRLKGASTAFSSSSAGREHEFTFTRAFAETESQEAVYGEALKPLVTSFVEEGISVTAMAYGQTGSGKTHTVIGPGAKYKLRGFVPRAINDVFSLLAKEKEKEEEKQNASGGTDNASSTPTTTTHRLRVSFLQAYNETLYDLLDTRNADKPLEAWEKVKLQEKKDGSFSLTNLTTREVSCEREALNAMFEGNLRRMTAETPLNAVSSRSHVVFSMHLERLATASATASAGGQDSTSASSPVVISSAKLQLVDLAGSERIRSTTASATEQQLLLLAGCVSTPGMGIASRGRRSSVGGDGNGGRSRSLSATTDQQSKKLRREGKSINLSLHHLEQVVMALYSGQQQHQQRAAAAAAMMARQQPRKRSNSASDISRTSAGAGAGGTAALTSAEILALANAHRRVSSGASSSSSLSLQIAAAAAAGGRGRQISAGSRATTSGRSSEVTSLADDEDEDFDDDYDEEDDDDDDGGGTAATAELGLGGGDDDNSTFARAAVSIGQRHAQAAAAAGAGAILTSFGAAPIAQPNGKRGGKSRSTAGSRSSVGGRSSRASSVSGKSGGGGRARSTGARGARSVVSASSAGNNSNNGGGGSSAASIPATAAVASPHIPWRNSVLTSVLRDSLGLGANCRTILLATLSPEVHFAEESLSTCRFAARCGMLLNTVRLPQPPMPSLSPVTSSVSIGAPSNSLVSPAFGAFSFGFGGSSSPQQQQQQQAILLRQLLDFQATIASLRSQNKEQKGLIVKLKEKIVELKNRQVMLEKEARQGSLAEGLKEACRLLVPFLAAASSSSSSATIPSALLHACNEVVGFPLEAEVAAEKARRASSLSSLSTPSLSPSASASAKAAAKARRRAALEAGVAACIRAGLTTTATTTTDGDGDGLKGIVERNLKPRLASASASVSSAGGEEGNGNDDADSDADALFVGELMLKALRSSVKAAAEAQGELLRFRAEQEKQKKERQEREASAADVALQQQRQAKELEERLLALQKEHSELQSATAALVAQQAEENAKRQGELAALRLKAQEMAAKAKEEELLLAEEEDEDFRLSDVIKRRASSSASSVHPSIASLPSPSGAVAVAVAAAAVESPVVAIRESWARLRKSSASASASSSSGALPAAAPTSPSPSSSSSSSSSPAATLLKSLLQGGQVFIKHGRQGVPHPRFVWVDSNLEAIHWREPGAAADFSTAGQLLPASGAAGAGGDGNGVLSSSSCIPLASICEVVSGRKTAVFARKSGGRGGRDFACFSVVAPDRTLDLEVDAADDAEGEAAARETRDKWTRALRVISAARKKVLTESGGPLSPSSSSSSSSSAASMPVPVAAQAAPLPLAPAIAPAPAPAPFKALASAKANQAASSGHSSIGRSGSVAATGWGLAAAGGAKNSKKAASFSLRNFISGSSQEDDQNDASAAIVGR